MSDPSPSTDPTLPRQPARRVAQSARERTPPWLLMLALLAVVVLCVVFFGSTRAGTRLVTLELLVGTCALSVGGLLGFLFGIPRTPTFDAPPPEAARAGAPGAAAAGEAGAGGAAATGLTYQPSTNLEQVSDWLTKILIGVGLVEFDKAADALGRVGARVQRQVGPRVAGADVLTEAVIVVCAVVGFLASFLWTRIYYGAIQVGADSQALQMLRAQVSRQAENAAQAQDTAVEARKKAEGAARATEALLRGEINVAAATASAVPAAPATAADEAAEHEEIRRREEEWPGEVRARVERFLAEEPRWDNDPTGELFADAPSSQNGRTLTADVVAELGQGVIVLLRVDHVSGPPLQGEVTFLTHPTFNERLVTVAAKDGRAETKVYAAGTFTAVAIADAGRTVLAYNLAQLPDAPAWFLAN